MAQLDTNTQTNLKQFISRLINRYQPVAVQQQSFFLNDVLPDLFADTNTEALTSMMSSLLYVTARCSKESCIHITAGMQGDIMTISLQDNNAVNNYAVLYEFQHLKILAQQLKGYLDINTIRNRHTIISLSFENIAAVAQDAIIRELKRA